MHATAPNPGPPARRRFFLVVILLALAYPILRFLGYKVPVKPRQIEVKTDLKPGAFHLDSEFILFVGDQGPWAVSRKCTHLGCKLNIRDKEGFLECPCHQSRFTPEGVVLQGPAQKPLTRFKVETLDNAAGYIVTL